MKKKRAIFVIVLVLVSLFLSGIFHKQEIPQSAVDSVVKIIAYHADGEMDIGSGFVFNYTGSEILIATCEHVVADKPEEIAVFIDGGENGEKFDRFTAKVVCTSQEDDVAVISIEGNLNLQPLPLTEAGLCSVVYAIGYPFSTTNQNAVYYDENTGKAATIGRIIAFAGGMFRDTGKIIHSAAGTHGASGGALVNWKGEAVGIVAFGITHPVKAYGAVSARELQKICDEAGIGYTHHVSTRLIRDGVAGMLALVLLILVIPDDKKSKQREEN